MTAHEIARKLLEGPDLPVVDVYATEYGDSEAASIVTAIEPMTVWELTYSASSTPDEELRTWKPDHGFAVAHREIQALRLR